MFSPVVVRRTLGLAAVLSLVLSVVACFHTGSVGQPLRSATSPAPRGGLSLQLPLNDDEARRIVEDLGSNSRPRASRRPSR